MGYFIVENFANGLDLRKSAETAPTGSLRVLRNAFINEGGEIEKRKAFQKETTITAYGQNSNYKGRITGPHECPGYSSKVFFRHRHNSLPGGVWAAGAGTIAEKYSIGTGIHEMIFWAAKSTITLNANSALFHATSFSEFSNNGYLVEKSLDPASKLFSNKHIYQTFTNDEPTSEAEVAVNADRAFQETLLGKGYVVEGKTMYASAVNDPTDMAGVGSGATDITTQGKPIGDAIALADYFGQLAIFGRRGVQFYTVDPSFAANQYQRTLAASVFAPRTIAGYGDGDVMFLGRNGIRSLRARDSSNLARVSDAGSPIDRLLQKEFLFSDGDSEAMFNVATTYENANYYNLAPAIVHPDSGQLWVCLKDKIYVLSRFPGAKVQAWSTFDVPVPDQVNRSVLSGSLKGRWVADICPINETLIYRNYADEVFIYGGTDGEAYDDSLVEVELPYLDMGKPGHNKSFIGIDLVCEGEWDVEVSTAPPREDRAVHWIKVASINGSSRFQNRIPFEIDGMQLAIRLTSRSEYAARIGQVAIYYQGGFEK